MPKPSVEIMGLVAEYQITTAMATLKWLDTYVAKQDKLELLRTFLSIGIGGGSENANKLLEQMGFNTRIKYGEDMAQAHKLVLDEARLLGLLGQTP